jgi:hypothetical protein
MKTLPAVLYADLIGKRWVEGARGPDAYDCVGIAIVVTQRRGYIVPDFLSDVSIVHRQLAEDASTFIGLTRIPQPEAGCLVLIRNVADAGYHLGVMVDPHKMLHSAQQYGSAIVETLSRTFWHKRVVGFYHLPKDPEAFTMALAASAEGGDA